LAIKVGMVSLGCPKNQIDAEIMLALIQNGGFELVSEAGMAEIAIVNTCGFINDAKEESIAEILELAMLKKEGKIKKIIVTGCMAERYKNELLAELPEVDAVVGIGKNSDIVNIINHALNGETAVTAGNKCDLPLNGERLLTTPPYLAYLKIAEGCDNRCSYCAIPMIRGPFRSRKMDDILSEAQKLAQNGVRELVVVAQDTTRYGLDLYGKRELPSLCKKLCKIDGIEWIRLLYCYPNGISDELLDVIVQNNKMAKYIDMPLQHSSESVLKNMNRSGNSTELLSLINKIRQKVPGITLRTTVMVGFPGESEDDFNELSQFVKDAQFDRLGCFTFSAEEDTAAFDMPNQVNNGLKEKRRDIIMQQQMFIMEKKLLKLQNKTISVLCEGYDKYAGVFFGRSQSDAPEIDGKVFFSSSKKYTLGSFVDVLIEDIMDYDLIGSAL